MEKKAKYIFTLAILAIVAIIFIAASIFGTSAEIVDNTLIIKAPFFSQDVNINDIESVEILSDINYGKRVFGSDFITVKAGDFNNSLFGSYKCAVVISQPKAIVIKTKSADTGSLYTVFNVKSSAKLDNIAAKLMEKFSILNTKIC